MNYRTIGFGLGAFAAGAVAWTAATAAFGPRPGSRRAASNDDESAGSVSPGAVRMADAPLGMAERDKHFEERAGSPAAEHVPTDLMGDTHPGGGERAVDAFRPDPTAVPTAEERESLRPATGPAPTLVADRGSGF
jgi:hypothetical protein